MVAGQLGCTKVMVRQTITGEWAAAVHQRPCLSCIRCLPSCRHDCILSPIIDVRIYTNGLLCIPLTTMDGLLLMAFNVFNLGANHNPRVTQKAFSPAKVGCSVVLHLRRCTTQSPRLQLPHAQPPQHCLVHHCAMHNCSTHNRLNWTHWPLGHSVTLYRSGPCSGLCACL